MSNKIIRRLFGNTFEEQEKYLTKHIGITIPFIIIGFFWPGAIAIAALIWGWTALKATMGINRIAELFNHNIVVVVICLLIWVCIGYIIGIIIFIVGIICFTYLKLNKSNKDRDDIFLKKKK